MRRPPLLIIFSVSLFLLADSAEQSRAQGTWMFGGDSGSEPKQPPKKTKPAPAPGSGQTTKRPAPGAQQKRKADLEHDLQACGDSCPDSPELEKRRLATVAEVERQEMLADEAELFGSAVDDIEGLENYRALCVICEFRAEAEAQTTRLRNERSVREEEERQYREAHNSPDGLRRYLSSCQVCDFSSQALEQIEKQDRDVRWTKIQVCNHDPLPVYVSVVAFDSILDLWMARGWYAVDPGQCRGVADVPTGTVYIAAESRRGAWPAYPDNTFCLPTDEFTRALLLEGDACVASEKPVRFLEVALADPEYTWNLNAAPWTYIGLAYSPSTLSWGWSARQESVDAAVQVALETCSQYAHDCTIARWVRDDACLAFATGPTANQGTAIGWASSSDKSEAFVSALTACENSGGFGCNIVRQSCP